MDLAVHSNQSEKKTRMARCVVMAVDGKHLLLTERASLSGPRADSGPVSAAAGSTKTKKKKIRASFHFALDRGDSTRVLFACGDHDPYYHT
jgi:hypothetical protein